MYIYQKKHRRALPRNCKTFKSVKIKVSILSLWRTDQAMPNWNFVKRQLKFDKPRYLFTETHNPKTKTQMFYDKTMHYLYI